MAWTYLFLAGLCEVGWSIGLKLANGFSKPLPSVLTIAAMAASMFLLALALRVLPIGTAYAVWTGIGTVGAFVAGIVLFGESMEVARLACVLMIAGGIAGLRFLAT